MFQTSGGLSGVLDSGDLGVVLSAADGVLRGRIPSGSSRVVNWEASFLPMKSPLLSLRGK